METMHEELLGQSPPAWEDAKGLTFSKGDFVVIHDSGEKFEVRTVVAVEGGRIRLDEPLNHNYGKDKKIVKEPPAEGLSKLQVEIRHARNKMYAEGRDGSWWKKVSETVLFTRILDPMLEHSSTTIYAPDKTVASLVHAIKKLRERNRDRPPRYRGIARSMFLKVCENRFFCAIVLASGAAFQLYGNQLTCLFKTTFLQWAILNQKLDPLMRWLSITGMMGLRMVVSNVFPFTSPAFAYLIATSQPLGQEWQGTFYLLACSIPAGLIVPFFDWLLYWIFYCWRSEEWKNKDRNPPESYEFSSGARQFDHHFHCTNVCAKVTDHLPFSFWVRPAVMEPAYRALTLRAENKSASATAVLAGHFMIWAGPATTMCQRLFVPDWVTCAFIQPIGLLEDVAVVLAAWAGSSDANEKAAEITLYFFMLYMNLVQITAYSLSHGRPGWRQVSRHIIVAVLTLTTAIVRFYLGENNSMIYFVVPQPSSTTSTTTPGDANTACGPSVHSNVKVAGALLVWVSTWAVIMRLLALAFTCACCHEEENSNKEVPLSSKQRIGFRVLLLLSGVVTCWIAYLLGSQG